MKGKMCIYQTSPAACSFLAVCWLLRVIFHSSRKIRGNDCGTRTPQAHFFDTALKRAGHVANLFMSFKLHASKCGHQSSFIAQINVKTFPDIAVPLTSSPRLFCPPAWRTISRCDRLDRPFVGQLWPRSRQSWPTFQAFSAYLASKSLAYFLSFAEPLFGWKKQTFVETNLQDTDVCGKWGRLLSHGLDNRFVSFFFFASGGESGSTELDCSSSAVFLC